jgi:hypothetical protein
VIAVNVVRDGETDTRSNERLSDEKQRTKGASVQMRRKHA